MKLRIKKKGRAPSLGGRGERMALLQLMKNGYVIRDVNFRCPLGEIDLVVEKGGRLFFVEVKTRTSVRFGRPEEAVGYFKQKKLIRLAEWYLKEKHFSQIPFSFMVAAIIVNETDEPQMTFFEHAFQKEAEE